MQILRVQDPRDMLEKARRCELLKFAQSHGVTEIVPQMPATLMRRVLRNRGLTQINIQPRQLGELTRKKLNTRVEPNRREHAAPQRDARRELPPIVEVDAEADLMRQFQESMGVSAVETSTAPAAPVFRPYRDPAKPTMAEVKKECKRRGLKPARTTKMPELIAMLERMDAQNAA